jgi:iron complex transport system substrate-binding protein
MVAISGMRVVSLLPAGTEMVAALGAESSLVGISHECDYPASVTHLPRVTWTPIDPNASSHEIDRSVRELQSGGKPVIAIDAGALRSLSPDLILTQGLCEVCAVADGEVFRLADALDGKPAVISLSATNLAGIMDDIRRVARALHREPVGDELIAGIVNRLRSLGESGPAVRPRVVCVEWLDPIYLAGHWVPELVGLAGGRDVGAEPGAHSVTITADQLRALQPDLVVVMLCGFGIERARRELELAPLPDLGVPMVVIDGNAYTSRPGPRVVDAVLRIREAIEDVGPIRLTSPARQLP